MSGAFSWYHSGPFKPLKGKVKAKNIQIHSERSLSSVLAYFYPDWSGPLPDGTAPINKAQVVTE